MTQAGPPGLILLWITQDKAAAREFVFRYARNSKLHGWWDTVRLVVWGPSAKLLAEDEDLQIGLEELRAVGIDLFACKACADQYGVSDRLAALGIEVIYMGQPLTRYLKEGWATLTV